MRFCWCLWCQARSCLAFPCLSSAMFYKKLVHAMYHLSILAGFCWNWAVNNMETLIVYIIFGELDLKPQSVLQDSVLFCVLVCIIMITRMFSDMHSNDNYVVQSFLEVYIFSWRLWWSSSLCTLPDKTSILNFYLFKGSFHNKCPWTLCWGSF